MELLIFGIAITVLLLLRVPVAFAFIGPSLVYMLVIGQSLGGALRQITNAAGSFPLLAVPLFVFLGALANHTGMAERLFRFAHALLARVRGGLGYVVIGSSVGFSWMSGSTVADAAALGKVQIPAMLRAGYDRRFATGLTSAAAVSAAGVPPSIPAVIFAGLAATSTGALFAASLLPALLMAVGLCVVVFVLVRRNPRITREEFRGSELVESLKGVVLILFAPVIILGGILGGIFTPTEAAAAGVAYVLVIALVQRVLTWRALLAAVRETVLTTAGIMLIVTSAALLGYILALERLPQLLTEWLFSVTSSGTVFLILVALLILVLGTAIDATAILVLCVPILLPIAISYGVDPIVLGVVFIGANMIGLLTPPVGTVLFVVASISNTRVGEVFRGSLPFLIPSLVVLALAIAFPDAVLWLPRVLGL